MSFGSLSRGDGAAGAHPASSKLLIRLDPADYASATAPQRVRLLRLLQQELDAHASFGPREAHSSAGARATPFGGPRDGRSRDGRSRDHRSGGLLETDPHPALGPAPGTYADQVRSARPSTPGVSSEYPAVLSVA